MTSLIAQRLSCYVANLRQVVHEQIDSLSEEVREEVVWVAKHTTTIRDDRMRDELEQRRRIMVIPGARRSKGREEQSQVLPLRLPILYKTTLSAEPSFEVTSTHFSGE